MAGFLDFSVIFISYSSYSLKILKWFEYIWMMSKWCNWFFDKLTDGEPQFWGRYTWNILEYHTVEDPSARKFTGATICWRIRVAHHISWAEIQPLSSVTAREPNCCLELAAITVGTVGTVTCMLHACYSTSWKRTTHILRVVSVQWTITSDLKQEVSPWFNTCAYLVWNHWAFHDTPWPGHNHRKWPTVSDIFLGHVIFH